MGLVPAACDRVGQTRVGLPMMVVEIVGSRCRGGLAPTVSLSLGWVVQAAIAGLVARLPWVAMAGSQAWPVVITACRCRRMAAARTVWAWVGVSRLWSRVVRCR